MLRRLLPEVLGGMMKLWALNLVSMSLADALLTLMLLRRGHWEANPIWVAAIEQGWLVFVALKVLGAMLMAGLLMRARAALVLEGITVGMMMVVLWNTGLLMLSHY